MSLGICCDGTQWEGADDERVLRVEVCTYFVL